MLPAVRHSWDEISDMTNRVEANQGDARILLHAYEDPVPESIQSLVIENATTDGQFGQEIKDILDVDILMAQQAQLELDQGMIAEWIH